MVYLSTRLHHIYGLDVLESGRNHLHRGGRRFESCSAHSLTPRDGGFAFNLPIYLGISEESARFGGQIGCNPVQHDDKIEHQP